MKDKLREELAQKLYEWYKDNCPVATPYDEFFDELADYILSPYCLKLLAPLYEVDKEKILGQIKLYANNGKIDLWNTSFIKDIKEYIKQQDVIKVK